MRKKKLFGYERRRMFEGMFFVSPWVLGFAVFMLYPLYSSLKISFTSSTLSNLMGGNYVGITNYKNVTIDPNFGKLFLGTITRSLIDIPVVVIFALFIAVLLNSKIIGQSYFRAFFFVPVFIAGAVMNLLFANNPTDYSIFDKLAGGMMVVSDMIGSDVFNRIGLLFWRSSVEILIFLAGLQSIPRTQYEAAQVDGATAWECFWKITLPYLSGVILLNFIYATIDSFTESTNPIMKFMQMKVFEQLDFGYAASLSWMYFGVVLLFIAFIMIIGRRFVYYGGDVR
ncbi:hypothetical protein B1748_25150 [Paenibacillus sp. MY03]|uniref:carbohydrate ABC transporter permease n=1 Tax=Paenibacillus sp. MY03 TaxID=302980 RepID=UPI000B3C544F|nr:sugar ABC transporter permease [Paenibacillus sp. MY03]OUS72147.1 hypothetical protein B1748_25150 [Paenibacillus sp. MY03]